MAFDQELADNIIEALTIINPPDLISKKMFGGIGYLVRGNMACGILDDKLIVRVGKEAYEEMLTRPGAGLFNSRGHAMTGWVTVDKQALMEKDTLLDWVEQGVAFSMTLPRK